MSRQKLINQLKKKNPQLNYSELESILDLFTDCIKMALKNGQNVQIRNFGSLKLKNLKASPNLRNPSTNELIYRPERVKVKFKASKKLNKLINE